MKQSDQMKKYKWFVMGDINGFFGMISDNMAVLAFLAGILIFAFDFPSDIVYRRMIPGTALGMLWGAFLVEMIDRRLKASSVYLVILGVE